MIAFFCFPLWSYFSQKSDDQAFEAEKAVSILPEGVEAAWLSYVDRRVAATVQRTGPLVKVHGDLDHVTNKTTIISVNTPYRVECDALTGGTVTFGRLDDSVTVTIFGLMVADPSAERAPSLGVNRLSIAATNLTKTLCSRLANAVAAAMASEK